MSWKSLLYGAAMFTLVTAGCASASYYEGENGRKAIHTAAAGQSIAYVCEGLTVAGPPTELLTELAMAADTEKVDMADIIRQIGFTQMPQGTGLCVVAKGGPIDQEIQGVLRLWLWKAGFDAAGDALSELIGLGHDALN